MRKIGVLISLMLAVAILVGFVPRAQTGTVIEVYPAHASFVTPRQLGNAISSPLREESVVMKGRIVSGVVPHHLLAGGLTANLLEALAHQKPKTIIIIGPNHHNQGARVITGLYNWQSPDGIVMTRCDAVKTLINKGLASRDEKVLAKEHSIGSVVPLIRHFMPQAKVVPIILHQNVSLKEVDALLQALEPYLNKDTVLLASVDFSHYLTRREAEIKDAATLRYMRNHDYTTLFHLGNDYLDSPASLACAFRLAEKRGIKDFGLLANTNSGIIMRNDSMETTSYFILAFAQK
ncbi:MAG: AmmeMemoRadiSam system protein B [Candidatus Saccharibacteria bacterium]